VKPTGTTSLSHRGRAVDDLSGGHLLGYEGIEYRYLTQEKGTSAHFYYRVDTTGLISADHTGLDTVFPHAKLSGEGVSREV
jgi:hypothetical protein